MPELPEVETIARDLARQIVPHRITCIERLQWDRMIETPTPQEFCQLLPNQTIQTVRRRAKWLLLDLDPPWTLALHLRMSGRIWVAKPDDIPDTHTHLILQLDSQQRLFFHDVRKFGRVRLLDHNGLAALNTAYGPEPLADTFTPAVLATTLARSARRLKPLLLDQSRVAGLGNIYVDESLWHAHLHPARPATSLTSDDIDRLYLAIRTVLTDAIAHQGSTLRDYRTGYNTVGTYQHVFTVYQREGLPCFRCGTPIERHLIAQRGTRLCPHCQHG